LVDFADVRKCKKLIRVGVSDLSGLANGVARLT